MAREIKFTETVLRDAHQSLVATRMTTDAMLPILETMDQAGYYSLECWGGATFDSCLRFLNEDPWERLRTIRKHVKNTKLQMLLRGQNLLGYKNYPDDVIESFVGRAIENGIDILRIFDALNDTRNLETSFKAVKKHGGHAQGCICYTISDIHTDAYYCEMVKVLEQMGADSIAIKDMAGILSPGRAFELVQGIKRVSSLPLSIHTHETSGTGSMTLLKAVEAGADIIDTAISPLSSGTSQPPTETMDYVLREMGYETSLKQEALDRMTIHFKGIRDDFRESGLLNPKVYEVDPGILETQVPGGMLSNLLSQLKEAKKEDRYEDVLAEVPKVRAELGFPPLVTPLSQMVGTQAVMNVLAGERYKMVPKEVKDYVKGLYGKTPGPIAKEIQTKIIGNEEVITCRPADLLPPQMEEFRKELGDLARSQEDVLSYASFPQVALPFLKKRNDPWYDVPVQNVTVEMPGL